MESNSGKNNPKEYFATFDADDCSVELMAKVRNYYDYLSNSGYLEEAKRAYTSYYGRQPYGGISSMEVRRGGEQGELALVKVNHYRNLIQHLLVLTTSQQPAMEARATNTDAKSQAQTILADGVLDYYMREKRLDRLFKEAAEYSLVLDEGFMVMDWDTTLGREVAVDPNSQKSINEGDISFFCGNTLDVIRDPMRLAVHQDWYIIRTFESRYELAAKYPEKADEIKALSFSTNERYRYSFTNVGGEESPDVPVYTFLHRKSAALPNGRMLRFLDAGLWLLDNPLPFKRVPVFKIAPSQLLGTIFGFSPAKDLLGLQTVVDSLYSTVVTNQTSFGVQNILVPKGHDMTLTQLAGGLNVLEYDTKLGKPESLQLTNTPAEVFKFIDKVEQVMETISGVNSVARGNPEASLESGSALALVQSMAVQFSSGLQQSYASLVEDVGTAIIEFLQTFPTSKRVAAIAGKSMRAYLKEFGPEDLNQINRVEVDLTNPISKMVSGRLEIARDLLQNGMIKNPQQYIMVLRTGKLDPLIEGEEAELYTAREENENLMELKPVKAVLTDDHPVHIAEHKKVINTSESRQNPQLLAATLQHIQEHLDLARQMDPGLQMILKQPQLPPPPPPPGAPPPAPGPQRPGGPPAPPQRPNRPVSAAGAGPLRQDESPANPAVQMPRMPKNPMTGQRG